MPHTNEEWEKRITEVAVQCAYHIGSWYTDEGEYQPTEEEAMLACEKEIASLLQEARAQRTKEVVEMMRKELTNGNDHWCYWKSALLEILDGLSLLSTPKEKEPPQEL